MNTPVKPLIIVRPIDVTPEGIQRMEAAGYAVIFAGDPGSVRIVTPGPVVDPNDLLMAAMGALDDPTCGSTASKKFVADLYHRLTAREAEQKGDAA
jgi:hypothetical protein